MPKTKEEKARNPPVVPRKQRGIRRQQRLAKRAAKMAAKQSGSQTTIAKRTRNVGTNAEYEQAKMIAKMEGARGVDSRSLSVEAPLAGSNVALVQQDPSVNIVAYTTVNAVAQVALGAILHAVQRGWFTQTDATYGTTGPTQAYNAWVYLTQAFINTMLGTYPTIQGAPDWFWHICDAIRPKTVPFKTASATYSWNIGDYEPGNPLVIPTLVGYDSYNLFVFGDLTTAVTVDGFPTLSPCIYDQAVAERAIQALFSFYPDEGMTKRLNAASTEYLKNDISAFAAVYPEWGSDANSYSPNGIVSSLYSEVKIRCPILAKFSAYDGGGVRRGQQENKRLGGAASYMIPRIIEFTSVNQFSNKSAPNVKFYNFDEFYEILSLVLGKALGALQSSSLNSTNAPVICPLSPLEVQLLLRQAMLPIFSNHMAQALVMNGSQTQMRMVPFSVASNGYSDQVGSAMKLPYFLAETIRACARKCIIPNKQWPAYQVDCIPVLSRPSELDQLANYTYTVNGNTLPVYSTVPGQLPIDLIDLHSQDQNQGVVYCSLTGTTYTNLLDSWNEFMVSISNCLAGVAPLGTERGIRALWTGVYTTYSRAKAGGYGVVTSNIKAPTTTKAPLEKQKSRKTVQLGQVSKVGEVLSLTPDNPLYQLQARTAVTSSVSNLNPLWKYIKVMPLPWVNDYDLMEPDIIFTQVNYGEGFRVNMGQDTKYQGPFNQDLLTLSVYDQHEEFASMCVRSPLGGETELEVELKSLATSGRGGFFTSIAGLFAENVLGIRGAQGVANQIGDMIGI